MTYIPGSLVFAIVAVVVGQAAPAAWGETLRDIGFVGGALVLVWAFYTGRVHSDREFREVVADRDKRILEAEARADRWREIATSQALPLAKDAIERAGHR